MTREIFDKSVALAKEHGEMVTIGGGEPTLHPLFKEFVFHAIWEMADLSIDLGMPAVGMVTNGSNTDIALTLAKLASRGVISCSVSHDEYHDPIDEKVYKAFKIEKQTFDGYIPKPRDEFDCRGINEGHGYIIPVGRAKGWGNHPSNKCGCDAVFIKPDGRVYPCGCRKTAIGNIAGSLNLTHDYFEGYCEKSPQYKSMLLDHLEELQEA
jgi:MoaA/NifB/PqqE/SkfB family radical SAM enzyme